MIYRDFIKRGTDIIISIGIFIVLMPLFLLLAVLLTFYFRGTPFFSQIRPGRHGNNFRILKFKTMRDAVDVDGNSLRDEERITSVGSLIRKASLDEIPQLFNVIKGDMSLVGPRPLLVAYLPLYSTDQQRRHEVRPGLTGWAQVNGRNSITWEQKFSLDIWYIDHLDFLLDLRILYRTFFRVLVRTGVSQEGHVTMGRFKGTIEMVPSRKQVSKF